MRILVLSPISPWPIFTGGRRRLYHITQEQARRHEVTFLSFWRSREEWEGLEVLGERLGVRVVKVPFVSPRRLLRGEVSRDGLAVLLRRWRGQWSGLPREVVLWDQPQMHRVLRALVAEEAYDVLQVEWPYLAPYALAAGLPPTVLITHDVFSVGMARRAAVAVDARERAVWADGARRWAAYETWMYPQFHRVAAMSRQDAQVILERAPNARVIISPNGVDARGIQPGPVREQVKTLLFVGSPTHDPNLDGACWLLSEVWPVLKARYGGLSLVLVNLDHPRVHRCARGQAGVRITGRVPEVLPFYREADIALAPLRAGSGTRLKILEAFAAGVPVVSTSMGYEGLEVEVGRHLLAGDSSADFVAAVEALIGSVVLRRTLAAAARALVEEVYDWARVVDRLDEDYERLVGEGERFIEIRRDL